MGLRGDAGMLKLPGMLGTPEASALIRVGSGSAYCCSNASTWAYHSRFAGFVHLRLMAGCGTKSRLVGLSLINSLVARLKAGNGIDVGNSRSLEQVWHLKAEC